MPEHYVDPAAEGENDGYSWADAWTDIQVAFDTAVAGDTVYYRGTQTLSAPIDVDTQAGLAGSFIKFIGCNAAGVNDGTRAVLDANSTAANCLKFANARSYIWFENLRFTGATSHGVHYNNGVATPGNLVWVNCESDNNVGHGFNLYRYSTGSCFVRCYVHDNSGDGLYQGSSGYVFVGGAIRDNGGHGADLTYLTYPTVFADTLIQGNGADGVNAGASGQPPVALLWCTLDGQYDHAFDARSATLSLVWACRFTNNNTNQEGLAALNGSANAGILYGFCGFYGNDGGPVEGTTYGLSIGGVNTNVNMAAAGYVGGGDYTIDPDTAELVEVALPLGGT